MKDCMQNKNPFRVPDGYFEGLAAQVMEQLPVSEAAETPQRARMWSLRPWLYMAASVLLAVGCFAVYRHVPAENISPQVAQNTEVSLTDDYFDEAADYVMLDNSDIYACLMND